MAAVRCLLGLALVATAAGCDACTGKLAAELDLKDPPPEVVHQKIRERLRNAKEIASTMCGVPSSGLNVVTIKDDSLVKLPGVGHVRVEGTPAEGQRSDAGAPLLCVAVLLYSVHAMKGDDGAVKEWRLESLELSSVHTPGVHWTAPPSHHDWD